MDQPVWRKFELLVAVIEERLAPKGAIVKSPDRLRDIDTGRWREVDATIRLPVGSTEILVAIECRKRKDSSDVTWIEQLATKRAKVGAAKIIAVSERGFSKPAIQSAARYAIELRVLGEITSEIIDEWALPEPLVHAYCLVESLRCDVTLQTGQTAAIDEMDARFSHPMVHGNFPPSAFVSFLKMKDPAAIWDQAQEDDSDLTFILDGNDPLLIPVPLGVPQRKGHLMVEIDGAQLPVEKIELRLKASRKTEVIPASHGRHFAYGPPGDPMTAMSQFEGEIAGVPVTIERMSYPGAPPSAVAAFPNGLRLPSQLRKPHIVDMSTVDLDVLHRQPIRISVRQGVDFEGNPFDAMVTEGMLIRPIPSFFESDEGRKAFNQNQFMFLTHEDWAEIVRAAEESETSRRFWELVKIFPHSSVEFIDLSPLLATFGGSLGMGSTGPKVPDGKTPRPRRKRR